MATQIPSQRKVSVSLIEGHQLARAHLKVILSEEADFQVAEVDPRALKPTRTRIPEVFILSHIPGSVIQGHVKLIRRARKNAKMLLVGQPPPVSAILSLLRSGVHGFVSDGDVVSDLRIAVRTLVGGCVWIRLGLLESRRWNRRSLDDSKSPPVSPFTTQQLRVAELVRENLSNKEIAAELGISERTVKFHLRNIFMLLGIDNRHSIRGLLLPGGCPPGQPDLNFQLSSTSRQ